MCFNCLKYSYVTNAGDAENGSGIATGKKNIVKLQRIKKKKT